MTSLISPLIAQVAELEAERNLLSRRLEEAKKHMRHDRFCKKLVIESRERGLHEPRDPCSCGLDAFLKEGK